MSGKVSQLAAATPFFKKSLELRNRRAVYLDIAEALPKLQKPLSSEELEHLEKFDLIYRTLCGILFNFVPTSGHPGGSLSCARLVEGLLFYNMAYDLNNPSRNDNDLLSFGAGHKA